MPRRKIADAEKVLSRPLVIRFTEKEYNRLEKMQRESDCRSIGEVVRKILANRKINLFHHDFSMNGPMEELALIRRELKAIGININQQTHRFHLSDNDRQRAYYFNRTKALYGEVGEKVDSLLDIVSKLAEKWLRG